MIKHTVIWRLKEEALGNSKATNAQLLREKLEAMRGNIPGLLQLEAGVDFSAAENSGDVVLVTAFASREDLAAYQAHPLHRAAVEFIVQIVSERRVVDCETDGSRDSASRRPERNKTDGEQRTNPGFTTGLLRQQN